MKNIFKYKELKGESYHYYDSLTDEYIYSIGSKIFISIRKKKYHFTVPIKKRYFLLKNFRIFRRLFRLDMMNVVLNHAQDGLIIIFMKNLYFYNLNTKSLDLIFNLKECRNVPYNSIAVTKKGIYFGEYSSNRNRNDVKIWCSKNDGISWEIIHKLPGSRARHIHGIYHDDYTNSLWICTGDLNGECFLYNSDYDFNCVNSYGDGTQKWRPISLIFEEKFIIWGMDSNYENSKLVIFNRDSKQIELGQEFPGPIWYSKVLDNGVSIFSSGVEKGEGVKSNYAIIFYSENNRDWYQLAKFKKDFLPMPLFKNGVISFASGNQNKNKFIIFGEGLVGIDGRSFISGVEEKNSLE